MTRNKPYRSLSLAVLVVLAAAVGAVAATGAVAAQDAGENGTDENGSTANASEGGFYSPSEDDPLNVRFRDAAANTVESVAEGVLNLNIVYGMFDGPYDVEITASNLSEEQVDDITFDNAEDDPNDLGRTDIVGMNFTGVPAGEYEFTVSVVGEDAESTVPLEVTGNEAATNETMANESADNETTTTAEPTTNETEMGNETTTEAPTTNETGGNETTTGNETEMGNGTAGNATAVAGNTTITAVPSATNTSANHTVSTVVGPNATGNLTQVTINYRQSNTTIGLVGGNIQSATLGGQSIINNTTAPTIGAQGQNLTIGFDGTVTVSEGDRLNLTFGGVTNPPEPGTYTVGVAVNNGTFDNATLVIGQNATAGNETEMGNGTAANGTAMGNETAGNASITAVPSGAGNESATHNISVVAGPNATGNLSQVTINYRDSNASIGLVGGNIHSATLAGKQIVNNTTAPTIGANGQNLTIGFDGTLTVNEGDRLRVNYSGVTNPPEPGTYTVGIAVNNGSFQNATLEITESTGTAGTTTAGGGAGTTAGGQTTAGGAGTAAGTAAGTSGGTGTAGGGQQGTEAGGPGFGIAIAVVALLAAALLAVRRN